MGNIRRLVLDVLKPHSPSVVFFASKLSELQNVEGVNISLSELDVETESVKITIVGTDLDFEEIKRMIESLGGVVHSVDEVVAGKKIVESVKTEQD
ncbi:MAG: hypothetical protein DSO01_03050 [Archaeoglobi archaeon]|jgi:hypothetical protein|nr:DUF211 domain-containing protein [Archaeoglobus sp.]NHW88391.1 DUF211 domain-containing protein [Archaeoglobales archaeon]TDA27396.1 MAG: hypothetical protein DSO01_03050 [Archaeoglobi archaeon]TDA28227.1 MAG: hypothetical protein DSN99_02870 [Archaeoglobi archaeon]